MPKKNQKPRTLTGYGEGTIFYSNSKGKWMGQINVGKGEDGKIKRKSVTGETPEEVKQKLKQIEFDIYTGTFVNEATITFEQLEKQILEDRFALNEFQQQTYYRHLETLKMLKSISKIPLQQINYSMIKQLMIESVDKYSDSTIRKQFLMLNQCFNEAVKRKIIKENPMKDMKRPKSRKKTRKIRGFTIDEELRFIEALEKENPLYKNQMLISLFTGMRMGEVNALKYDDVNTTFNVITIDETISNGRQGFAFINNTAKTDAGNRTIPINKIVKPIIDKVLADYKETPDRLLFHSSNGTIVTTGLVHSHFKQILKKYNIVDPMVKGDITLHSLRHTYATRSIESGMQAKVLQKLLGHTDISVTLDTYSDVFDSFQSENIERADDYMMEKGFGKILSA